MFFNRMCVVRISGTYSCLFLIKSLRCNSLLALLELGDAPRRILAELGDAPRRIPAARPSPTVLKNIDSLQQRLDVGCLRLPSFTINHRWQHSRPKQS